METKSLLKKVHKIEIKIQHLSDHFISGQYHSRFKGRGMTFSEVRPYQYGDDVRTIDWNKTAQYRLPFVKIFEEERALSFMLVVDMSGSQFFGTQNQTKRETLAEICATLAFAALRNQDYVGLLMFTDEVELYIPPKKGKKHVLRIIRELIQLSPKTKGTQIAKALQFLGRLIKRRSIIFILSDFTDETPYDSALSALSSKHDITGIRLYDSKEVCLPNLGMVYMQDAETQKSILVDTASKRVQDNYNRFYERCEYNFFQSFNKIKAHTVNIDIKDDYLQALLNVLKQKHA